ncbi:hypothetical protein GCM10010350_29500 [Streptomyces galilaeus]|nr:hypothetical protein GCM10010350_29500 [Streptomyces galilaeus]
MVSYAQRASWATGGRVPGVASMGAISGRVTGDLSPGPRRVTPAAGGVRLIGGSGPRGRAASGAQKVAPGGSGGGWTRPVW